MTIRQRVISALTALIEDEVLLREADSRLGDGDLGFTVAEGSKAVIVALENSDGMDLAALLKKSALAFGSANPSTFAALIQTALLSGSKAVAMSRDDVAADPAGLALLLEAAAEGIARRGKAEVGDKTILDPITATIPVAKTAEALESSTFITLRDAAARITNELAQSESRKGRAAWLQERSKGAPDAGSVAYVMFLGHLADA